MKSYIFPYYISYGKGDSVESEIECELTNKEASRLEKSAQMGDRFHLDEDNNIIDIYEKVLDLITEESDVDLDAFTIGINYPEELQDLECTYVTKRKQAKYDSLILSKEEANKIINYDTKYIIYIDDGKTLYWVPRSFTGILNLSGITKIHKFAICHCKKIREIIIDDGLTIIEDSTFRDCDSLKRILLPKTLKRIEFGAFLSCYNLSKIDLPEGLEYIDHSAFRLSGLTEISIPKTVKSIDFAFFLNCHYLEHIYFYGMNTFLDGNFQEIQKPVIHGFPGSKIEDQSKVYNFKFSYIE